MSNQVCDTILAQLGGSRFIGMTGAKNLVGGDNYLMFMLPRGAKQGINKVKIDLDDNDTYTITFYKYRALELKEVSASTNVYVENLRQIFTRETGLDTSL